MLIGHIDPSGLIAPSEVPGTLSSSWAVPEEPTAQGSGIDSKDSRPRIGEAVPEPASSSTPMEFSIADGSVAGSKRSWASSSWQALRTGSSTSGSLLAHTQVPGLEADVSAVDQLADFLIEEQDVFLSHGETTAENLRSWVDQFSAVG